MMLVATIAVYRVQHAFVCCAPQQVEEFLAEEVIPAISKYSDRFDSKAELSI